MIDSPSSQGSGSPPISRIRCLLLLGILVPAGFAAKLYAGPGGAWVADSFAGLLYVVFWIIAVMVVAPTLSVFRVSVAVLAITSALEFLQRWHPAWLEPIRSTFLGHALLGNTFAWSDFPYYLLGAIAGAGLVIRFCRPFDASHLSRE
jgi:hypothetical protein